MISPGGGRKAAAQVETYWETEGLNAGTYDMDVTLYYQGQTANKKLKINVVEGKAPEIIKPKETNNIMTYVIIGSIIIIIFVAVYFIITKKGNNNSKEKTTTDDTEIKPPSF